MSLLRRLLGSDARYVERECSVLQRGLGSSCDIPLFLFVVFVCCCSAAAAAAAATAATAASAALPVWQLQVPASL